jgi:hypothetical protein
VYLKVLRFRLDVFERYRDGKWTNRFVANQQKRCSQIAAINRVQVQSNLKREAGCFWQTSIPNLTKRGARSAGSVASLFAWIRDRSWWRSRRRPTPLNALKIVALSWRRQ